MATKQKTVGKNSSGTSKFKIAITTILIIVLTVCAVFDIWWLYIYLYGDDVTVINTFEVSTISTKTSDDEESQSEYVIKVKYYSNESNNGYECLEIQFTGFVDENQTQLYSKGIQFIASSSSDSLSDWEYSVSRTEDLYSYWSWNPLRRFYVYDVHGAYTPANGEIYTYQSSDSFEYDITTTSEFSYDGGFLISLGDDIYRFSFIGEEKSDDTYDGYTLTRTAGHLTKNLYYYYYVNYDIYYMAKLMYETCQGLANGKNSASLYELPDMFKYEILTDEGQYEDLTETETAKVTALTKNYFSIYFEKTADGLQTATDSMFNTVKGTSQFNYAGSDGSSLLNGDDYFTGTTIVNVDIYDFDFIATTDDDIFELKLSDDFINYYSQYATKIKLSVHIDLDYFIENNWTFSGFSDDSGLDNFNVYEIYTTYTDGDETVTEIIG